MVPSLLTTADGSITVLQVRNYRISRLIRRIVILATYFGGKNPSITVGIGHIRRRVIFRVLFGGGGNCVLYAMKYGKLPLLLTLYYFTISFNKATTFVIID